MLEWLLVPVCLALVLVLGVVYALLRVVQCVLLGLALVVELVRAAVGVVCGVLWERVYP